MHALNITGFDRINFSKNALVNFGIFLTRNEGWMQEEAMTECKLISVFLSETDRIYKPEDLTQKEFLKYSRIGAKKSLNRQARAKLFSLYSNAVKHAAVIALAKKQETQKKQ
ncbi:hypothetical protein [Photobacterium kishitanii]|uniref:Uncharacterized protein n=1 Tax=Photobacterium kishitanii TaxID=318456 RepID=A0A2T3KKU6_9GAMM|nr:hypothetical protein [Photobacterium kishitanii]PSV00344.1 hypothetical protein C9J27_04250 [Photobacterium kishitanii]